MSVNLLPELAGRTFSGIVEKGDSNPADRACLTETDLAFVLVRWVIDIYHNTEHDGLDGETPAQCWERLTAQFGVTPPPDTRTSRLVFGQKIRRTLDKSGIMVLGAQYHSPGLAAHFMSRRNRELEVRWLPSHISAIEVRIDHDWVTVPAVLEDLHGVSAQLWVSAVRDVRAADPDRKRHDDAVIHAALRDIRSRSEDAQAANGLIVDDWSEDRLRREEQKLMIGFEVGVANAPAPRQGGIGRSIETDYSAASGESASVKTPAAPTTKPARGGKFKLED